MTRSKAKRRAPKHPKGPERALRGAVITVLGRVQVQLKKEVMQHARGKVPGTDLDKTLRDMREYGRNLLRQGPFEAQLTKASMDTASSVRKQTARALRKDVDTDLSQHEDGLTSRIYKRTGEAVDGSVDSAYDAYSEWSESEEAELDELEDQLDDGLQADRRGVLGYVAFAFAAAFGAMVAEAQQGAGVERYVWLTMHDDRVRPSHAALDGEQADWDEPPLSAEDSDSGEECHPGQDFGCRCVASPVDAA